jgi:hypothetical protein
MSERIRFHLDENVDPAIALGLRRYGINVTTTNHVEDSLIQLEWKKHGSNS